MIIDPETLDAQAAYKLPIGSVVPRPIAWVSPSAASGTWPILVLHGPRP
jgi:hypothetical protein